MFYVWFYGLGVDPKAHDWWDVFCSLRSSGAHEYLNVCVEQESLEHMSVYVCVERESLEHMIYENLCIEPEALKHMKRLLGIVGNNPWSLPSWCWA